MNYLCFSNLYLTVMVEDKLSELYCNYSGHRPYSVVLLPVPDPTGATIVLALIRRL